MGNDFRLVGRGAGERGEVLEHVLERHDGRGVVVDGEDGYRLARLVAEEDRARAQLASVLGARVVGKVILELVRVRAQGLEHHVGRAVPELSAGDLAILYCDDGAVGVIRLQVMDDDLAVASKLSGDALRKAREKLDLRLLHDYSTPFWRVRLSAAQLVVRRVMLRGTVAMDGKNQRQANTST